MKWGISVIFILLVFGCGQRGEDGFDPENLTGFSGNSRATRFSIHKLEGCTLLQVTDPWQGSQKIIYSYVLGRDKYLVPDSLQGLPFVKIPVRRIVTLSTTHVAMVSRLGKSETIVGASGTSFIYDNGISERIEAGLVKEIGYGQGLNYESIVALDPDVLFIYGVEGNVTTTSQKLKELGIPVVFCAEYLENHPLGKAEWIRFFACFYGMEQEADRFFMTVDSAYRELKEMTSSLQEQPRVLTGLPWKDTWYVAGGRSYASRLIEDAGGDYLWKDDPSGEAIPLDLESVYSKAIGADIWINPGAANSLKELEQFDNRFSELPLFRKGMVYNNNARMSINGGNDYWESGTIRPDLVLADLISVFHPDLQPDHPMMYYRKLK